jgi:hypothetical protein
MHRRLRPRAAGAGLRTEVQRDASTRARENVTPNEPIHWPCFRAAYAQAASESGTRRRPRAGTPPPRRRVSSVSDGCWRADPDLRQAAGMAMPARGRLTKRCPAPMPAPRPNRSCRSARRPARGAVGGGRATAGRDPRSWGAAASWWTVPRSPAVAGGPIPTCAGRPHDEDGATANGESCPGPPPGRTRRIVSDGVPPAARWAAATRPRGPRASIRATANWWTAPRSPAAAGRPDPGVRQAAHRTMTARGRMENRCPAPAVGRALSNDAGGGEWRIAARRRCRQPGRAGLDVSGRAPRPRRP